MRLKRKVLDSNREELKQTLIFSSPEEIGSSVLGPKEKWRTIVLSNRHKINGVITAGGHEPLLDSRAQERLKEKLRGNVEQSITKRRRTS